MKRCVLPQLHRSQPPASPAPLPTCRKAHSTSPAGEHPEWGATGTLTHPRAVSAIGRVWQLAPSSDATQHPAKPAEPWGAAGAGCPSASRSWADPTHSPPVPSTRCTAHANPPRCTHGSGGMGQWVLSYSGCRVLSWGSAGGKEGLSPPMHWPCESPAASWRRGQVITTRPRCAAC